MTTFDVVEAYEARLNKSDSQDYDNIWWYQIQESYYKGTLEVIRKLKKGKNQKQESDEETADAIDDLQVLVKPITVACTDKGIYSQTTKLPADYLYYKRLSPRCSKGNCENIQIKSYFREEANVDDLLVDYMSQPSFDFEQTFHTLSGNSFKIYHNKDFKVKEAQLTYYRLPKKYIFDRDKEYVIEFKDDLVGLFIDEGVKIMASDLESINQVQLAQQRAVENG